MRIETDKLTAESIEAAAQASGLTANVTEHGSRDHAKAFHVSLTPTDTAAAGEYMDKNGTTYCSRHRRWTSYADGRSRACPGCESNAPMARQYAIWSEILPMVARLYEQDAGARILIYENADDFYEKTGKGEGV